jgi:hypothetical protein
MQARTDKLMHQIHRVHVLIFLLTISLPHAGFCADVETKTMRTLPRSEGSVPPSQTLLQCIRELDNKPFSDPRIKECVAKLTANYFIRDVKVHTKEMEGGWTLVEFVLSGEPLVLNELTVHTFDKQESEILRLLSLNQAALRVGGTYNWEAESSTYDGIKQFYRAKGILIGVVPKVALDYKQGKARVSLTVVPGPPIPSDPLVPPYGKPCNDRITFVNWLQTDDGVPMELIDSGLALHSGFSCFSEELARKDKAYLSNMEILSSSFVDYSGTLGNRHIEYKLKAKPMKVTQINVLGYGDVPSNLADSDPSVLNNLSPKPGEYFSHSAVSKSLDYLKKKFSRDGNWAEVTVQEELSGKDALRITFSVLVFPLQTITVDGQEIK